MTPPATATATAPASPTTKSTSLSPRYFHHHTHNSASSSSSCCDITGNHNTTAMTKPSELNDDDDHYDVSREKEECKQQVSLQQAPERRIGLCCLTDNDVCLGKTFRCHKGNIKYRSIALSVVNEYNQKSGGRTGGGNSSAQQLDDDDDHYIIPLLVDKVMERIAHFGGRFLKQCDDEQNNPTMFHLAPSSETRLKISKALQRLRKNGTFSTHAPPLQQQYQQPTGQRKRNARLKISRALERLRKNGTLNTYAPPLQQQQQQPTGQRKRNDGQEKEEEEKDEQLLQQPMVQCKRNDGQEKEEGVVIALSERVKSGGRARSKPPGQNGGDDTTTISKQNNKETLEVDHNNDNQFSDVAVMRHQSAPFSERATDIIRTSSQNKRKSVAKEEEQAQLPSHKRQKVTPAAKKTLLKTTPGPTDVLCTKGWPKAGLITGHKYFRQLVEEYRHLYQQHVVAAAAADLAKEEVRASIRVEIEELILNQTPPGRFLQPVDDDLDDNAAGTTTFQIASDACIYKKLDMALTRHGSSTRPTTRTRYYASIAHRKKPAPASSMHTSSCHSSKKEPSSSKNAKNSMTMLSQQEQMVLPDRKTLKKKKIRPPLYATPPSQRTTITINSRISILWVLENAYYPGTVKDIQRGGDNSNDLYYIHYDDNEVAWTDLSRRKFKILQLA